MADTNTVILNTASYNQIKMQNFRYELFIENVFRSAKYNGDTEELLFDSEDIDKYLKFCFYDRYMKVLDQRATEYMECLNISIDNEEC